MRRTDPHITFVYQAESGLLNKLRDAIHKTFSPSTYPCKLCDVTYSPVHMRSQWKRFIEQLPFSVEFSYTDLIEQEHPELSLEYPCALVSRNHEPTLWLTAAQINACNTIDELIELVTSSLPAINEHANADSDGQTDASPNH